MAESNDPDMQVSPTEEEELLTTGEKEEEAIIVLAGKSGAGKSTLFDTLFEQEADVQLSAKSITTCARHHKIKRNKVKITVIDTPGFVNKKVKDPEKRIDLLVYCMSVTPGSKFDDCNPAIMKRLQAMYGKDIWNHCSVVLTFSNVAWERYKKNTDSIEKYKDYIEEFAESFEKELQQLKVKDMTVNTIFTYGTGHKADPHVITAIPAGDHPEDPVLPGVEGSTGWVGEVWNEMIKKSRCNEKLAKYRYGIERAKKILKMLGIMGLTAGTIGATATLTGISVGATAGAVGGPVGAAVGATVGGVVGLITGAALTAHTTKIKCKQ